MAANYLYSFKDQVTEIKKYIDGVANITTLSYSGSGCSSCSTGVEKLTSVLDAMSHETKFEYDQAGNLTKETDPLTKFTSYTHDARNNVETRTIPDSRMITYTYYEDDRLHEKIYSGGGTTTFQYDAAGRLHYAGNAAITYTMDYDAFNRLTQVTDSNNRTILYQYFPNGTMQMTTPRRKGRKGDVHKIIKFNVSPR